MGTIPAFSRGDRLRKARELTNLSIAEFADRLGVSPKTVGNAELDRVKVRTITLRAWALATGVPLEWLETGEAPRPRPDDGGSLRVRSMPRTPVFAGRRLAVA